MFLRDLKFLAKISTVIHKKRRNNLLEDDPIMCKGWKRVRVDMALHSRTGG